MAAVKVDRKGPLPVRRHRLRRGIALLALLQVPVALAEPVVLDAPALTSGGVARLGGGAVGAGLEAAGPQMICEQLRGNGAERCRPVARLAQVNGSPERHRPRGSRLLPAVPDGAPAMAEHR